MSRTESLMVPLGTPAPDFTLPDTVSGQEISLTQFQNQPLLVAFICNHCPYVKHIRAGWAQLAREYVAKGAAIVAISANDAEAYPDDSPALMTQEAREAGYNFPYLYDETQEIARAYKAACTPDFFVYDREHKLIYRGQMDTSRRHTEIPVTGEDLRRALDAALENRAVEGPQKPSIGCNIKWKEDAS